MNTRHEVLVAGLLSGTAYSIQVRNTDLTGNASQLTPPDVLLFDSERASAPPVLSEWRVKNISDNKVKISWKTDKFTKTELQYNLLGKVDSHKKHSTSLGYRHSIYLSRLKSGAPYEFFIVSTDLDGQRTIASDDMHFTTTSNNDKKAPIFVVTPKAFDILDNSALLTWQTDDFSTAVINFGLSKKKFDNRQHISDFKQRQSWLMSGLEVGTRYYYRVTSIDHAGNKKRSDILKFRTRGVALDTDADGIPDAHDLDDDNDGIPDVVELDYGLNSKNKDDGTKDLDADGLSNVEEFLAKTNLFKDTVAPVLSIPSDLTVVAMGPKAKIELGEATAVDYVDGLLPVHNDAPALFTAGEHTVKWRVADKHGNQTTASQLIRVIPSVFIETPTHLREGGELEVKFYFHGSAIKYPVIIPYKITGTATAGKDHNLNNGELIISQGNTGSITVKAFEDYAYDMAEYIDITLGDVQNAVASEASSVRIIIVE